MTGMTDMTYRQAMDDVRARVAASRSSFAAGMAVLPKERRDGMYALYAFCREVDDIADDGATQEERQNGLQEWRERIRKLFRDRAPSDSITLTLSQALKEFPLIEDDFQAIIDGMAMDAGEPICAPSSATLDLYCDRVASAVGRASVRIFGDASKNGLHSAHHLGRALQLTNILRDLAEDAERGRLYLPEELLAKNDIITRKPGEVIRHPNLALVCRDLARQAQRHFAEADAAMRLCLPKAMRPARIMRAYYGAILDRLIKEDWRDPFTRVALSRWQKMLLLLKSLV